MTGEDVLFLADYNKRRGKNIGCSDDEFEEVVSFFEETTATKQPFASVDNSPVLTYEELETEFDETIGESSPAIRTRHLRPLEEPTIAKSKSSLVTHLEV